MWKIPPVLKTSAIILRVADFLKAYPPFSYLPEESLLEVARSGRVRFCEKGEILFEEGSVRGRHLFVIQKGSVRLVRGENRDFADLRGQGDFIGGGGALGETTYGHTALVDEDSILYALDVSVFARACSASPQAARFLSVYVVSSEPAAELRRADEGLSWAGGLEQHLERLRTRMVAGLAATPVREAAQAMARVESASFVVLSPSGSPEGIVTDTDLRNHVATGRVPLDAAVSRIMRSPVQVVPPTATPREALFRMIRDGVRHLCVTADGLGASRAIGLLSDRDVGLSHGNDPLALVREIRRSGSAPSLASLRLRLQTLLLGHFAAPADAPWCLGIASEVHRAMFHRIEGWAREAAGAAATSEALVLIGGAGRGEAFGHTEYPFLSMWPDGENRRAEQVDRVRRIDELLVQAGFEPARLGAFLPAEERCRPVGEWIEFFQQTVRDPLGSEIWTRMNLFDLALVSGDESLLESVRGALRAELAAHPEFICLLANDALGNLPPVTIYEGYAVDASGLMSETVDLETFALAPVSDIARVFHLDGGAPAMTGTMDRLEAAAERVPSGAPVLRKAARAFRVAQYFRAQHGLRQEASGGHVRPGLLGRADQVMLRAAFRAIADLISFTQQHYVAAG